MRFKYCKNCVSQAVWIDAGYALAQAVMMTAMGLLSGSLAVHARGVFSLADFIAKLVNMISVRIGERPPDRNFPYGYGKIQFLSSLIIGLTLGVGAVLLLYENTLGLGEQTREAPSLLAVVAMVLSAAGSESIYRYLSCVGEQNNNTIIQDAAMDNRVDALSSVAVLIGVLLAMLGWLDAENWAAIAVSALILRIATQITYNALQSLMDAAIPEKILEGVKRLVLDTPYVITVEQIKGRNVGGTFEISLQVSLENTLSLEKSHQIVVSLKKTIQEKISNIFCVQIEVIPESCNKSSILSSS